MNMSVSGKDLQPTGAWTTEGRQPRIAIIGAGFSGIGALIKLRQQGYTDLTCFEKAGEIGGTWRDNHYPGLSCDVPSHFYSYSFALNPDWKHRFSYGPEILAYMNQVADKYGAKQDIRFNCGVTDLTYLGPQWQLTTEQGDVERFDLVIAATGVLVNPAYPDIPGLDSFAGEQWHSARWRDDVPLKGKRVGIIGTGSTACQIVGAIAGDVGHLDVFQRTPHWITSMPQKQYSATWRFLLRRVPGLQLAIRNFMRWLMEHTFARATLGDEKQQKRVQDACLAFLKEQIPDPELRARVTPDYKATCKRMIMCSDYYPALQQDNVELVTERIDAVVPEGVKTGDGKVHELDILLLATGFHVSDFILPTRVTGENGLELSAFWREAPRAHRALTFPGFPNFFMLEGPTGVFGNTSLIDISEHQIDCVIAILDKMKRDQVAVVAPKQEAYEAYNQAMSRDIGKSTWATGGCDSWYLDATGTPNIYPWLPQQYREDMLNPDFSEYRFEPLKVAV
ncbi:MAG: monooxygenase [Haliea sp.]|nr:monooxygenase [Haliea sp.]|tara:strand:- start:178106 stop:179629 length:1524 start_codon:yes stop_codon:yes gene_type:complete